ncbi:MAG: hypothetical protein DWH73_02995 [Planctomycetota bacterium]|nr:MAG: hypothetical protein DWH73_02995 [Planctomycetota bacterium]
MLKRLVQHLVLLLLPLSALQPNQLAHQPLSTTALSWPVCCTTKKPPRLVLQSPVHQHPSTTASSLPACSTTKKPLLLAIQPLLLAIQHLWLMPLRQS